MSEDLAKRKGFPRTKKKDPYDLFIVDRSTLPDRGGRVEEETTPLQTRIYQHQEELQFEIVRIASHEIILRIPWLKTHNPVIN